jgi:hypothetical protein
VGSPVASVGPGVGVEVGSAVGVWREGRGVKIIGVSSDKREARPDPLPPWAHPWAQRWERRWARPSATVQGVDSQSSVGCGWKASWSNGLPQWAPRSGQPWAQPWAPRSGSP